MIQPRQIWEGEGHDMAELGGDHARHGDTWTDPATIP